MNIYISVLSEAVLLTVTKQTEIESESAGETKGLLRHQTAVSFLL